MPGRRGQRTASFFSGGVDSFCVALRERAAPIDDLVLVLGTFDLVDAAPEALERVRATLQRAADALGKTLVPVTTNQIRTRMRGSDPRNLSGMSMLRRRRSRSSIAGGACYRGGRLHAR